MDIEKFNPTIADLTALVTASKVLTITDFTNQNEIDAVKKQRLALRDARTSITKRGKELREEAMAFQKAVIGKEKELVAIIEPEEERLLALEAEAKKVKDRADRVAQLPQRKEKLALIGDAVEISDDELLDMDAETFQGYCNKRFAEKNEADARVLKEREDKIKEDEMKIQREKDAQAREEKARQDERERMEREQKEKEEKAERERLEKIEKEKKDAEELAKKEKYQAFLKGHGWSNETRESFYVSKVGNTIKLYKLAGEFNLE